MVGPGPDCEIKSSSLRESVNSLTPDRKDRELVQFIPEIMFGIADKLKDDLGKIGYSLLYHQNATLMLFRHQNMLLS